MRVHQQGNDGSNARSIVHHAHCHLRVFGLVDTTCCQSRLLYGGHVATNMPASGAAALLKRLVTVQDHEASDGVTIYDLMSRKRSGVM